MCFPFFQYKMVKTKWKKSLDLEKFRPKKLKTSNFLEVLHAFLWYSFSSWDLCVYIFCKQLCQQKTSHLDIVTISQQYRAASRQWLLSNNIVQDLALACPTYSICLLGNSGKDYQYITTVLTDAALMAWKSGHCSLTLYLKYRSPRENQDNWPDKKWTKNMDGWPSAKVKTWILSQHRCLYMTKGFINAWPELFTVTWTLFTYPSKMAL